MARLSRRSGAGTAVAPAARSIDSFGRISKRVVPSSVKKTPAIRNEAAERFLAEKKKEQVTIEIPAQPTSSPLPSTAAPTTSISTPTKRKRTASDDADSDDASQRPSPKSAKRTRRVKSKPTTTIDALFSRALQNKNKTSPHSDSEDSSTSSASSLRPASTAPTTPCESESESDSCSSFLPSELFELLRLQAAFIKTLALHHAHHGSNKPVDLRELCPSVAQAWGKRKVNQDDIQRCIGGLTNSKNLLSLLDYGRGKVCIEIRPDAAAISTLSDELNRTFEASLRTRWAARRDGTNPQSFILSLPKAPITKCASLHKTSAARAKGQQTLEELMRGVALKKQEKEAQEALMKVPAAMEADQPNKQEPAPASMNLLDRIRYRQLQRTQLAAAGVAPPTAEELERRAALYRAADIAAVLSMLCTSSSSASRQSRVSFGMSAILTKLKDSLRLPIAREEAAVCVRLLAKEVAPQWIQLVSMGGREIVIMLTDYVPSKTEIESRVQSLQ